MAQVKYYIKETTNQIFVSGASSTTAMNTALQAQKDATPTFNGDLTANITTLGTAIQYGVQNGTGDTTIIPIDKDQELWIYRGFTPVGDQETDNNRYRYNPHQHRPYKAYFLTQTGSGIPSEPYLPQGNLINGQSFGTVGGDVTSLNRTAFNQTVLATNGNQNESLGGGQYRIRINNEATSGSFTVFSENREIFPYVFTSYTVFNNANPPFYGASYRVYDENYTSSYWNNHQYNYRTNTSQGGISTDQVGFNNTTLASATEAYMFGNINPYPSAAGIRISSISQSQAVYGKSFGQIRLFQVGNPSNYVFYDINGIQQPDSAGVWTASISNITSSVLSLSDFTAVTMSFSACAQVANLTQPQYYGGPNISPAVAPLNLPNSFYTYTGSVFDAGAGIYQLTGSTQFGLFTKYSDYVRYKLELDSSNAGADIRINYTSSGTSNYRKFFDLPRGKGTNITALVGSVSASGTYSSITYNEEIVNPDPLTGQAPPPRLATRLEDVYLSYSSSLSESIDGLYIFNQIPQNDVQVTVSMFLNAWTGSDPGSAKYGISSGVNTNTTYSISPDPPKYGPGEAGDGPTWPTASILVYTGSFPDSVPNINPVSTANYYTASMFRNENIHVSGFPVTMSFLIPSSSLTIKKCLQVGLAVTSSQALNLISNSLIVARYNLEFKTDPVDQEGDGLVPTQIDNAFSGSDGFSNAPDCQPLLNNVNLERDNSFIQLVEYRSNPYSSSNFQQILSGSAQKSTVPDSYYTSLRQINPRYNGSLTQADGYNTVEGLVNGFGTSPVVDYTRANLAYSDQVIDLYPVLNNRTLFNLKYLINDGGDARQPLLSPYTAFDVEATWDEGGIARVGINQISGSTQYDELNNFQRVFKVAKEPVPILFSQNSSQTFSSAIPLAGNPNRISNYNATFTQYGINVVGTNFNGQNSNDKTISMRNLLGAITESGQFQITYANAYGYSASIASNFISSSVITSSADVPTSSPSEAYNGIPGEVFFFRDPLATQATPVVNPIYKLSDNYKVNLDLKVVSSVPQEYRTDAGGWNDGSDYNRGDIGYIKLRFQYNNNLSTLSSTSGWVTQTLAQLESPTMTCYFDNPGQTATINLETVLGNDDFYYSYYGRVMHMNINYTKIRDAFQGEGLSYPSGVKYVTFNFKMSQGNIIFRSNRRYRWNLDAVYYNESVDARRNFFNPTAKAQNQGSTPIVPPVNGPFVTYNISGDLGGQTSVDNALNAPFWFYSQSSETDPANYVYQNTIYSGTPTSVTAGNLQLNNVTQSNATIIAINDIDSDGNSQRSIHNYLQGGSLTNKGTVTLNALDSEGAPNGNFITYDINSATLTATTFTAGITAKSANPPITLIANNLLSITSGGTGVTPNITATPTRATSANGFGVNATFILTSNGAGNIFTVTVDNTGQGYAPGEIITFSQDLLISLGFAGASSDLQVTLAATNLNTADAQIVPDIGAGRTNVNISFSTGSEVPQDITNVLILSSSNGNVTYNDGYTMGNIPYTASNNASFPGGLEPADTTFPLYNLEWKVEPNDEIRFENVENKAYKIVQVVPPDETTGTYAGKLKLVLGDNVAAGTNLDFFLLRRYRYSPNSLIIDKTFPYGGLSTKQEFIPTQNSKAVYTDALGNPVTADVAVQQLTTGSNSGSIVTIYSPLTKKDNTPTGIVFPEYPAPDLEIEPDKVIQDLRDKKLIT